MDFETINKTISHGHSFRAVEILHVCGSLLDRTLDRPESWPLLYYRRTEGIDSIHCWVQAKGREQDEEGLCPSHLVSKKV
jgi:hypothetical protein